MCTNGSHNVLGLHTGVHIVTSVRSSLGKHLLLLVKRGPSEYRLLEGPLDNSSGEELKRAKAK